MAKKKEKRKGNDGNETFSITNSAILTFITKLNYRLKAALT